MSSASAKIARGKQRIVLTYPWFASMVLSLETVEVQLKDWPRGLPETAYTDGKSIYYLCDFIDSLEQDGVDCVLIHESGHCFLKHHLRQGNRELERWNEACDYQVNEICIESGLKLPEGGLLNPDYYGKCAEEVYDLLPKKGRKPGRCFGSVVPYTGEDAKENEAQWDIAISNFMHAAAAAGKLSGNLERSFAKLLEPRIDWRNVLWDNIYRYRGQEYYTFARPSRRGLAVDLYLPSSYAESIKLIPVCIDTSGSMSTKTIGIAVSETLEILRIAKMGILLICADSDVKSIKEIDHLDDPSIKIMGGGGTNFAPALKEADKHDPCCIIYITDLEGSTDYTPMAPTIWVTNNISAKPPFGEMVTINEEEY